MNFSNRIKQIQNTVLTKLKLIKYKEQISYIVIGFLTTAVDFISYSFFVLFVPTLKNGILEQISPNITAYAGSWGMAVIFSYIANSIWVFESEKKGVKYFLLFVFLRFFTLGISVIGDILLCGNMALYPLKNPFIAKVVISVAIVILNYIACKFLIFCPAKR